MKIMIDAHVHFYSCFDTGAFFDAAFANFGKSARVDREEICHVLMMSEGSAENYFTEFRRLADRGEPESPWRMIHTGEEGSLKAVSREGGVLYLVAGRQIATAEGLEVLALATNAGFKDGEAVARTVEKVEKESAIPVIPWGFGKWWGRRGDVLRDYLESARSRRLFLGDNGGRARCLPQPHLFRWATAQGLKILPGSDPLPFPHETHRPGSFGFHLEGVLDPDHPAVSLRKLIQADATEFVPFGKPERVLRFARNQVGMQLKKRSIKSGGNRG
jgi:hypothetical protein